jgi:hypothetical protein
MQFVALPLTDPEPTSGSILIIKKVTDPQLQQILETQRRVDPHCKQQ